MTHEQTPALHGEDERVEIRCQSCDEPMPETYEGCGRVCKREECVRDRFACPDCYGTGGCAECCSTCGGNGSRLRHLQDRQVSTTIRDVEAAWGAFEGAQDELAEVYTLLAETELQAASRLEEAERRVEQRTKLLIETVDRLIAIDSRLVAGHEEAIEDAGSMVTRLMNHIGDPRRFATDQPIHAYNPGVHMSEVLRIEDELEPSPVSERHRRG